MKYISTRGGGNPQNFVNVMLQGLAPDGGLFIPQEWPSFETDQLKRLSGVPYTDVAYEVIRPFVDDEIPADTLKDIIKKVELINDNQLRTGGLIFAIIGFVIIYYIRS